VAATRGRSTFRSDLGVIRCSALRRNAALCSAFSEHAKRTQRGSTDDVDYHSQSATAWDKTVQPHQATP
jgi:hypothetical protein